MPRISRGSAEEKANRPFAKVLRSLLAEPPVTSQAQLADILGKTQQVVSQYVSGKSEPGYDVIIAIADYFQVSVDYLLGRTNLKSIRADIQIANAVTGLSDEALLMLFQMSRRGSTQRMCLIEEYVKLIFTFNIKSEVK